MTVGDSRNEAHPGQGLTREELLRRGAAAGGVLVAGGMLAGTAGVAAAAAPKKGGVFKIGVEGGSAKDFIDGQNIIQKLDISRLVATFEGLSYFDENYKPVNSLAEELTAEKPNQWLIRVRDGIEFHNGKTLGADDVIYSLKRTLNAKLGLFGHSGFTAIDPKGIKKLDKRTVRLVLSRPNVTLIDAFSQYFQGIVPVGYCPNNGNGKGPLQYIGTGAFKVKSFAPGRESVHVRNPNYWRTGQPYFDEVHIIDFPDATARVNALLGGQVHAITGVPLAQVPLVQKRSGLKIYEAPTGAWDPILMRVDTAPFTDVRVRQAFKMLANRPQMVAQALSGHGRVGNDIFGPLDQCYAGDEFPQRKYDPEQAKSLLKAAGQEGLTIDFNTTDEDVGMVGGAQIFAENAKAAGVTINVKQLDSGTFYGDNYLKWTLSSDFWGTRNYLAQVALSNLPDSTYNESHFNNAKYISLYKQAGGIVDLNKRCEVIKEMQKISYDEGGEIIPFFKNLVDAHTTKIGGLKLDRGTLDLNKYGNGFRTIYFV